MTMRRCGAVALSAMLVCLTACAGGKGKVQTLVTGVLRVGTSVPFKPFEYFEARTNRTSSLRGFDVDLVQSVADRLSLRVRWVDSNFDTIFASLASNNVDMVAAATTITPGRQQTVNFSNPYFVVNQSLSVNVMKTPTITSTDQLKSGDTVAAQSGTTGESWARANLVPKGIQVKTFTGTTELFDALNAGSVTGVINDQQASQAQVAGLPKLKVVQLIDTGEHYGLATSKSNPALLKAVNNALDGVIADGTYAKIFAKYFPGVQILPQFQR